MNQDICTPFLITRKNWTCLPLCLTYIYKDEDIRSSSYCTPFACGIEDRKSWCHVNLLCCCYGNSKRKFWLTILGPCYETKTVDCSICYFRSGEFNCVPLLLSGTYNHECYGYRTDTDKRFYWSPVACGYKNDLYRLDTNLLGMWQTNDRESMGCVLCMAWWKDLDNRCKICLPAICTYIRGNTTTSGQKYQVISPLGCFNQIPDEPDTSPTKQIMA